MENKNNDLDFDKIGLVTSDFIKVADQLKLACSKIVDKKFSKYPIIVMGSENLNLGTLFINKDEILGNKWVYYASYLEILIERNIIKNKNEFIAKYKNIDEFCCLLVVFENNSKIIYIPYPED
tara:strand:- start:1826 stop:2194 length:369 start_codon:yes stop_codon:yes gene_type:complete